MECIESFISDESISGDKKLNRKWWTSQNWNEDSRSIKQLLLKFSNESEDSSVPEFRSYCIKYWNRYSETQKPSSTLTIQAKYKDNSIFLKEVTTQGIEKEIFHLEIQKAS